MKFAPMLLALVLLAACQTAPAPIPTDASAEIYFQRAQAASDQSDYDTALTIYRSFLAAHPDAAHENLFAARYEVAFLLAKKGKTDEAIGDFEAIVSDYDNLERSSGAPAWVKVLSQKKLAELKEKAAKAAPAAAPVAPAVAPAAKP
jgi:tetratricopeptide (TPR) repeat protein